MTDETDVERTDESNGSPQPGTEWQLWPPSPKMQIAMIAAGFGLFNMILLAIWAIVMIREFG